MAKEMLINVSEGEECRIAVLEGGRLEELYMERTSSTSHVGNIYKGRVTNVEPSIQAAFVDFGLGRNGFLHISDLMPSYFGRAGMEVQESVGRKISRRDRPPIQKCLRRGDEIVVQIIKEGIGTKGPTLSTYLSVPGRILVMMPGMSKFGISRKVEDEEERRRLRTILDSLKPIDDVGFIIRTAGVDKTKAEIQRDLTYLTRLWQSIAKKRDESKAPVELYTEGDLVTRTVRDVYSSDIERLVVDNKEMTRRIKEFFKLAMPRTRNRVELYEEPVPLFHKYGIEHEIEQIYSRHVPLPSGGSLVIDQTEAIVAIDVNSGKFREHADAEMTAFKTDMEAADEIPRQLRLRDLGGVIICDFIDLRHERHRREVERKLHDNLKRDRAKTKVLRMSQFGIIEMTRQRMRPSLKRSIYYDCPNCHGHGLVKTPESISLDVMRRLTIAAHDKRVAWAELAVNPQVETYLANRKRSALAKLEDEVGKRIIVRGEAGLGGDEMMLSLWDDREGRVYLSELGMAPEAASPAPRGRGGRQGGRPARPAPPSPIDEARQEMKRATDAEDEEADEVEPPESNVVDVDEGHEPMGEAAQPIEEDDRPRRGDRQRGDRRGGGRPPRDAGRGEARQPEPRPSDRGHRQGDAHQGGRSGQRDQRGRGGRQDGRRDRHGGRAQDRSHGRHREPPPDAPGTPAPGSLAALAAAAAAEAEADLRGRGQEALLDEENEGTPGNIAPVPAATDDGGDAPKKRRRRRGGRRHRRRRERERAEAAARAAGLPPPPREDEDEDDDAESPSGNDLYAGDDETDEVDEPDGAPSADAFDDGPADAPEEITDEPDEPEAAPEAPVARRRRAPRRTPPRGSSAPPAPLPPAPRTGSTDKHLADDEPVVPDEPPRRPRSVRDLDALPDFED